MANNPQDIDTGSWLRPAGILPPLLAGALFVWFATMIPPIAALDTLRFVWNWVPSLGINLSFFIDGLSLTFSLLISGIGILVFLYASKYMQGHVHFARFMLFIVLFMLSMLGLVLADNLLTLFVFWELTTITSYLLIGFEHTISKARRNALQALLVTGTGGLALLAGFILIGTVAETFELSEIRAQGSVLIDSTLYLPILLLFLAGTFTKSAQFPMHFWLPNAMAAPTPVSAYLHSATMVKAGIYLMARMHPSLGGTEVWLWTLTVFGAVTAVFASVLALKQTDLKQALAYTTLMALGTLTLFLAGDVSYAITAAMTFLLVHCFYKAALFLVVGIIDHETGTRDIHMLGGLARAMPVTCLAAGLAALSMAGFPPFLGFIGKELKYAGALAMQSEPYLVAGAVLVSNALMFAVAGIVSFSPFWRRHLAEGLTAHEAPWQMLAGPLILAACGAVFGIYPSLAAEILVNPGVVAIAGSDVKTHELKLWEGINPPLILSLATFVLGVLIYNFHRRLREWITGVAQHLISFDRGWDQVLEGLKGFAIWQTQIVQSGYLRRYLFLIFFTLSIGLAGMIWWRGPILPTLEWPMLLVKHWVVIVLIVAGSMLTLTTSSRVAAIAGLGAAGIGVALIFIIFGAPDVAITQLLVDTLVVVLFASAALKLPFLEPTGRKLRRPLDAILALSVGTIISLIMLIVTDGPVDRSLTTYFEEASWTEAFGRNIVNVILVDFRALDTFGEIAVVVIAALGAYAILKGRQTA
ncbi:MAG: putative monovalent cation/H+ antiporter subunit A [Candidatus Dadabacteria bacterium]|nr:putative monovalent cation/H+ antiporter subunit A [Candidatus Dadabacteria bacterium]